MIAGRFVTHAVLLPPPEKCCHGATSSPYSEKRCLWCAAPDLFDDEACPTRCMTVIENHEGDPDHCAKCRDLSVDLELSRL